MSGVPLGDPGKGASVFKQRCAECHTADMNGRHKTGPNLFGLFGRRSGGAEGYTSYSQGTHDKSITWNEDTLFIFLEAPKKFIPGTKMVFAGLKKEIERADLIAHLKDVTERK